MRTHLTIVIGLALLFLSPDSRGQDIPPPDDQRVAAPQAEIDEAKANVARVKVRPVFKSGPDAEFPESERALGHHGIVTISGILGVDGHVHYAKVEKGTGAPVLDQSALKRSEAIEWTPAKDADGNPIAVSFGTNEEFFSFKSKAPGGGLPLYTCGQFVLDMDWWRATFPDAQWNDHQLYKLVSGVIIAGQVPAKKSLTNFSTDFQKRWTTAIETCRSRPNRKVLDVLPLR